MTTFNLSNITIQWNPVECSQRNGEINGYRLLYFPTRRSNENQSILINGSTNTSFTIVGLQPRAECTLRLSAVNGNYTLFGPDSEQTMVTSKPNGMWLHVHEVCQLNSNVCCSCWFPHSRPSLWQQQCCDNNRYW